MIRQAGSVTKSNVPCIQAASNSMPEKEQAAEAEGAKRSIGAAHGHPEGAETGPALSNGPSKGRGQS